MADTENPDDLPIFARNLRTLRAKAGMSQRALSGAMQELGFPGVYQSTISRFEQGTQEPRLDEAQALAYLFDISIDDALVPLEHVELIHRIRELRVKMQVDHAAMLINAQGFGRAHRELVGALGELDRANHWDSLGASAVQDDLVRQAHIALEDHPKDRAAMLVRKKIEES